MESPRPYLHLGNIEMGEQIVHPRGCDVELEAFQGHAAVAEGQLELLSVERIARREAAPVADGREARRALLLLHSPPPRSITQCSRANIPPWLRPRVQSLVTQRKLPGSSS